MSIRKAIPSARRERRRAPRPLTAALAELLRAQRPPITGDDWAWVCLTPATAAAIARIAARRDGSLLRYREHPAHAAVRQPIQVSAATAGQWCLDAWQAADEGLIDVADALAFAAQIDPPGVA